MDGVAARLEAGILGSVAGCLGVIEAQMRKMLHLHMLVQLHGFSHPDDIFRRGDLEARIKQFGASLLLYASAVRKQWRSISTKIVPSVP